MEVLVQAFVLSALLSASLCFYCLLASDDRFYHVGSFALFVFLTGTSLCLGPPPSALAFAGRILAYPSAAILLCLSGLVGLLIVKLSGDGGHIDRERGLFVFDEITTSGEDPNGRAADVGPIDIIAVHGLGSNPETTWLSRGYDAGANDATPGGDAPCRSTPPDRRPNWLRDFLRKDVHARVLVFHHTSRWQHHALSKSVADYARDLLDVLCDKQQIGDMSRPIILIGHSFGGLVVKQAFVMAKYTADDHDHRSVSKRVIGFIFLGTPHRGSELTYFARVIPLLTHWHGASTRLLKFMEPRSEANWTLHENFVSATKNGPEILCVSEALPETFKFLYWSFPLTQVVPRHSAVIDGAEHRAFETRHTDLQRFATYLNVDYRKLVRWIEKTADIHRERTAATGDKPDSSKKRFWAQERRPELDSTALNPHAQHRSPGNQKSATRILQRTFSLELGAGELGDGAGHQEAVATCATTKLPLPGQGRLAMIFRWREGFDVPFTMDDMPGPKLGFVPREEIRELERALLPDPAGALADRKIFVLHGLGGIGKTRLAVEFAIAHHEDFDSIFFLNGENITTLQQSYAQLLRRITQRPPQISLSTQRPYPMSLPQSDFVDGDAPTKANEWLCLDGNTNWLLIFDNIDTQVWDNQAATDGGYSIKDFFPRCRGRGAILITTRLARLAALGRDARLISMDESQTCQLLAAVQRSTSRYYQMDAAEIALQPGLKDLLKLLEGLPLAIKMAGAYISAGGIAFTDFVRLYKDSNARVLRHLVDPIDDRSGGIRTTWTMSFNQIQVMGRTQPKYAYAAKLLRLWVLLDHRGVSFKLLANGNKGPEVPSWFASMTHSELNFHETIQVLIDFSLVECARDEANNTYSMHRILHDWCAWFLPQEESPQASSNEYLGLAVRVVGYSLPRWSDDDKGEEERRLLPHADAVYESVVRDVPDIPPRRKFASEQRRLTAFGQQIDHPLRRIAKLYDYQNQHVKAIKIVGPVLDSLRRRMGPDHELTVLFELELASILLDQNTSEAERLCNHVLQQFDEVSHPSYPHALTASNLLAIIYSNTGRKEEAVEKWRELVELSSQAIGHSHYRTLIYLQNLGLELRESGQLGEAVKVLDDSLKRRTAELGRENPRSIEAMKLLADAYTRKGDHSEAEKLRRDIWELCKTKLGLRHAQTLWGQDSLAESLVMLGRVGEAVDLSTAAIGSLAGMTSGTSNKVMMGCLQHNLGRRLRKQSNQAEAESAFKKAFEEFHELPNATVLMLDASEELLDILLADGRVSEADRHIDALISGIERWNGEEPDSVMERVVRLAKRRSDGGDFAKSFVLYERATARFDQLLSKDHRARILLLGSHALCLLSGGEEQRAETILTRVLPLLERAFGPRHEFVLTTIEALAESLQGEEESRGRARDLLERALFMSIGLPSGTTWNYTVDDFLRLGNLYETAGWLGEAEFMLQKRLGRLDSSLRDQKAASIAAAVSHLGVVCLKKGELGKARKRFEAVSNKRHEATEADSARNCLCALDRLGKYYEFLGQTQKAWEVVEEAAKALSGKFGREDEDYVIALQNRARLSASLGLFDLAQRLILRLDASKNKSSVLDAKTVDEVWRQCGRHLFSDDGDKWLRLAIVLCTKHRIKDGKAATVAKSVLIQRQNPAPSGKEAGRTQQEYRSRIYLALFGAESDHGGEEGTDSGSPEKETSPNIACQRTLVVAAATGDVDMARAIISSADGKINLDWHGSVQDCRFLPSGSGVVTPDGPKKHSALTAAAAAGDLQMVELLLDNHASADKTGPGGWTPLHCAASSPRCSKAVVERLLRAGVDVNSVTDEGLSVLHAAAMSGDPDVVRTLLDHDAAIKGSLSDEKLTPLHLAARRGREEAVEVLLDHDTALMNAPDGKRRTALHHAVSKGEGVVMQLLLSRGADLQARDSDGFTPLQVAFLTRNPSLAYGILERAKSAGNIEELLSWELLECVVKKCPWRYAELLFDAGADIHMKGGRGATLLHVAAGTGDGEVAKLLLRLGADREAKDVYGFTALARAASRGDDAVLNMLLGESNIDVNAKDHSGRTALSNASSRGHTSTVEKLLARQQIETDVRDRYGSSPLSLAARHGHKPIVDLLLASGRVDASSRDCFGRTPLWYARRYGEVDIAEVLVRQGGCDGDGAGKEHIPAAADAARRLSHCDSSEICDVCTLFIQPGARVYRCRACCGGNFDTCTDCYAGGARCLMPEVHELTETVG